MRRAAVTFPLTAPRTVMTSARMSACTRAWQRNHHAVPHHQQPALDAALDEQRRLEAQFAGDPVRAADGHDDRGEVGGDREAQVVGYAFPRTARRLNAQASSE